MSFNQIVDINPLISAPNILKVLLTGNQIAIIPKALINKQRPIVVSVDDYFTSKSASFLADNPITTPPLEIVAQGTDAMLSYYQELEGEVKESANHNSNQLVKNHLFEAKMLVIGEPGAGKTSLVRKVKNPEAKLPQENETTHGIDLLNYHFTIHGDNFPDPKAIEGKDFRVNLWDFGGQEIYKATHRFFYHTVRYMH